MGGEGSMVVWIEGDGKEEMNEKGEEWRVEEVGQKGIWCE